MWLIKLIELSGIIWRVTRCAVDAFCGLFWEGFQSSDTYPIWMEQDSERVIPCQGYRCKFQEFVSSNTGVAEVN